MESFLILNLTTEPKRIDVLKVDGPSLELLESSELQSINSEASSGNKEKAGEEQSDSDKSETSSPDLANSENTSPAQELSNSISAALKNITHRWNSCALIYEPTTYFSCNLDLPFKDEKSVGRVIDSEVQDLVNFDLDEFILDYKVIGENNSNGFDVHIALASKDELNSLITACQASGLDPMAVSTLSSLFKGKLLESPQKYINNCCFIQLASDSISLCFKASNKIRADRKISLIDRSTEEIISEVKRTLILAKKRFGVEFDDLIVEYPENSLHKNKHSNILSELESNFKITEKATIPSAASSSLALALGDSKGAEDLLVNFRTGELAKVLGFYGIWKIFNPFLPYLLLTCFLILFSIVASYFSKESEIASLQQQINTKVSEILEVKSVPANELVNSIKRSNETIDKQLSEIGSPAKFSPLEVLATLSKDFSGVSGVEIASLTVKSTDLIISGTSTSYEAVDAVADIFAKRKDFYCKVTRNVSTSSNRQFTFTVSICE
jgi:hypothetical protein